MVSFCVVCEGRQIEIQRSRVKQEERRGKRLNFNPKTLKSNFSLLNCFPSNFSCPYIIANFTFFLICRYPDLPTSTPRTSFFSTHLFHTFLVRDKLTNILISKNVFSLNLSTTKYFQFMITSHTNEFSFIVSIRAVLFYPCSSFCIQNLRFQKIMIASCTVEFLLAKNLFSGFILKYFIRHLFTNFPLYKMTTNNSTIWIVGAGIYVWVWG